MKNSTVEKAARSQILNYLRNHFWEMSQHSQHLTKVKKKTTILHTEIAGNIYQEACTKIHLVKKQKFYIGSLKPAHFFGGINKKNSRKMKEH